MAYVVMNKAKVLKCNETGQLAIQTSPGEPVIAVGSGSGGAQADWSQNDETAPDYVKNRPFWTGDPAEAVIVEETTFESVDGIGMITSTHPLEVGTDYTITLDGTTYNCVAKLDEEFGTPYAGNVGIVGGEDTGEPFFIAPWDSETDLVIIINSDVAEHTVSVIGMVSKIYKVDKKYLPDIIPFADSPGVSFTIDVMVLATYLGFSLQSIFNMDECTETTKYVDGKWNILKEICSANILLAYAGLLCNAFTSLSMDNDDSYSIVLRNCVYQSTYLDSYSLFICSYAIHFESDGETITMRAGRYNEYTCPLEKVSY